MMSSDSNSKSGEGRGLPVGFAWEDYVDGRSRLVGTITGERITLATAFPNGGWRAGVSSAPSPETLPPKSLTTTFAPRRAKASANARPMPMLAPVMRV